VLRRWPIIITKVIDEINQRCHDFSLDIKRGVSPKDLLDAKIKEALAIVNEISKLKYEMARDRPIKSVQTFLSGMQHWWKLMLAKSHTI